MRVTRWHKRPIPPEHCPTGRSEIKVSMTNIRTGQPPAIIDRELLTGPPGTAEAERRGDSPKVPSYIQWTGTVICGQCGSIFKRKKCRESAYWTCRLHDKSPDKCQITQIPESEFERAFLRLYYKLRHHGMPVLSQLLTDLQTAQNRKLLWSLDIVELNKQIADIVRQERLLAELKQQGLVDPDIYITRSNTLAEQLRTAKLEKERFLESEEDQTIRQTQVLLEILETGPEFLEAFDEELFSELVAKDHRGEQRMPAVPADQRAGADGDHREDGALMAGNRKQPFGYRMEFGEYTPHPAEAETVRWIYQTYLAGASYQELVEALQERGIAYDEGKLWNKNMVARILEDKRYSGTDRYPAILPEEQYRGAQERRRDRRSRSEKRRHRWSCGGCAAVPRLPGWNSRP